MSNFASKRASKLEDNRVYLFTGSGIRNLSIPIHFPSMKLKILSTKADDTLAIFFVAFRPTPSLHWTEIVPHCRRVRRTNTQLHQTSFHCSKWHSDLKSSKWKLDNQLGPITTHFQRINRDGIRSISHGIGLESPNTFSAFLGPCRGENIPHPIPFSDISRDVDTRNWATRRKVKSTGMKRFSEVCALT